MNGVAIPPSMRSSASSASHIVLRSWTEPIAMISVMRSWIIGKPDPRRTGDLADIVDLMLATCGRIVEISPMRWADRNLDAERPTLTTCGARAGVVACAPDTNRTEVSSMSTCQTRIRG
jgi:hypothetical protein